MPEAFNLIDASWLPVRRRSGAVERIPPWRANDRIGEDPVVAFDWPRADFNGAAHELLIGLLSTAAAPGDDDEWVDWWREPPAPEVLRERFARVAHAFDLDGAGPRFLQDLDPLEGANKNEIAGLLIDAPSGQTLRNNADLFVKRGGVPVLSRATAAMALYTLNAYAPEGGRGYMTSLRGGGPMTTLVVADHRDYSATLWGRLWPNVETKEQIEGRASDMMTWDDPALIFPWLAPTRISDPKAGGRATTPADVHPLQVYWWMPRRIRLLFEGAQDRPCGLTGDRDPIVIARYRTRNYGINKSEGFEHPLTPYRRQKADSPKLPVHPEPGGISYRLWPSLVCKSSDKLSAPAQVVRHWYERTSQRAGVRLIAFGYNMKKNKARAWIENEMPLWLMKDTASREWLERFIEHAVSGADTVTRLLIREVKTALYGQPPKKKTNRSYELPKKTKGDYGFIAERFYRETEPAFYAALRETVRAIEEDPDGDDPALRALESWAPIMAGAAMRLFDEYAPMDGLEGRNMERHVEARFCLERALGGHGKQGRPLFDQDLGIASPGTARARKGRKEAA